ncbi:MAG: hypothetical protein U0836_08430 [Pirellulales bacterium]
MATSADGDLVAVWTSAGQDGDTGGIYAQRFTAAVAELLGDANGDQKVDLADFGLLKQHFGATGDRATGDFDGDGRHRPRRLQLLEGDFWADGRASG